MKILATLDWDGIEKGLVGVAGLVAILVSAAKLINTEVNRLRSLQVK